MLSSTTSTTPLSPPVTPKEFLRESSHSLEDEVLQLPPAAFTSHPTTPPPTDLRRKSNARRYSRAMSTADKDAITFRDPFAVEGNFYLTTPTNRSKSTPQRSPSPSTRGSFTMDIFEDIICAKNGNSSELSKKRRNSNMEEQMAEPSVSQLPVFSTASILNTERHVKKSKTDAAAAYDKVDITMSDEEAFQNPDWIPDMNVFEQLPSVRVVWKGKF